MAADTPPSTATTARTVASKRRRVLRCCGEELRGSRETAINALTVMRIGPAEMLNFGIAI